MNDNAQEWVQYNNWNNKDEDYLTILIFYCSVRYLSICVIIFFCVYWFATSNGRVPVAAISSIVALQLIQMLTKSVIS